MMATQRGRDIDRLGYPLPCEPITGCAYWRLNLILVCTIPHWGEWQKGRAMAEIIPEIRRMIEQWDAAYPLVEKSDSQERTA